MRRRGNGTRLGDARLHALDNGKVHIGGGQVQMLALRLDQDVRKDRYGVAPFHHALHMSERFQELRAFDGELHGTRRVVIQNIRGIG